MPSQPATRLLSRLTGSTFRARLRLLSVLPVATGTGTGKVPVHTGKKTPGTAAERVRYGVRLDSLGIGPKERKPSRPVSDPTQWHRQPDSLPAYLEPRVLDRRNSLAESNERCAKSQKTWGKRVKRVKRVQKTWGTHCIRNHNLIRCADSVVVLCEQ